MATSRFPAAIMAALFLGLLSLKAAAQPANDNFTNAAAVVPAWNPSFQDTSGSFTVARPTWYYDGTAALNGATLEAGEPNHANANGISSVWFTYTAPAAGELRLVTPANFSTAMAVYTGTALTNLTSVGSSTGGYLSIGTGTNVTYYIAFTCPGNNVYAYPFAFYFFPPPANDNFTNAALIPNTYATTNFTFSGSSAAMPIVVATNTGYTLYATAESGEEGGSNTVGTPTHTVWYSFVAPTNGYFSAAFSSSANQYMDIGQGSDVNFTNVTSTGLGTGSALTRMLVGGQTYYVRLWGSSSYNYQAMFYLSVLFYPQPPNDYWSSRVALPLSNSTVGYSLSYSNLSGNWNQAIQSNTWVVNAYGATRESGEQGNGQSVWYGFAPSGSGVLNLTATNIFGGLMFWLMNAQSVSSYAEIGGANSSSADASESIVANVSPATNYSIQYGNWNGQEEDAGQITAYYYPAPANDMFTNRQPFATTFRTNYIQWQGQNLQISVDEIATVAGSTLGSSTEPGEPYGTSWPPGRSTWYSWTPYRPQPVDLNTYGSVQANGVTPLSTVLGIYTGSVVSNLTNMFNGPAQGTVGTWGGFSQITPAVGTPYSIQILDKNGGGVTLLNFRQWEPPADDNFSNSAVIGAPLVKQVLSDGSIYESNFFYAAFSNATTQAGEPNNGTGTVWYNWTPDMTAAVTFRMNSSFGGNFYVYTGTVVSNLTTAAYPAAALDGSVYTIFNAVSNTTYYIQIRGGGGAFSLSSCQYHSAGIVVQGNYSPTNAYPIYPTNVNAYLEYSATLSGNATNTSLPAGSTNALTDLENSGAQLNAYYNSNFAGSNSMWWSYTAHSNDLLVVYNTAVVSSVTLRSGTGYDPDMDVVNPAIPLVESENVVFTPQGAYCTNANSSTLFASRPDPNGAFRVELSYMYLNNPGNSTYNIIVASQNGSYAPLAVRNSDLMLGTYYYNGGNPTFVPFNCNLVAGQDTYIAVECNGATGSSSYTLWVNNVQYSTVTSGWDGNSYYIDGIGACGGRVHDLRIYNCSPVSHEAFEIWQGNSLIAINDDVVMTPCTAGTTYEIRTTPLDGQGTYFPFSGNTQNSLGLTVNSYNNPVYTNDPSPDPGAVSSLLLFGTNPYITFLPDGGFETPNIGAGNYSYNCTGGSWTFVGNSGIIAQNCGPWGGDNSGYGNQFGFVQMTGYCYETLSNVAAGTYNLTFVAASRPGYAAQDFDVLIDGNVVSYFMLTASEPFTALTTSNFTLTAGNHTLEFKGVDSGGGDRTAFLDNVYLNQVNVGGGGVTYNNYLDITDPLENTSYTISLWVKVPSVQPMGIIGRTASAGIGSVELDDLHITAAGVFEHVTESASGAYYTNTGTTAVQAGTWYHIAITASAGGQQALYVNGAQQGTANTIPSLMSTGDRWQVGTGPAGYNYFAGEMGGLAIYHNTVLSPSQIASLASGTVSPLAYIDYLAQFSLLEYFPMAENHNIADQQTLIFTNNCLTWTMPNGTVTVTDYVAQASCYFADGFWGPEWNPAGIGAPGGELWYTFVPPVTNTLYISDPYASTLGEYLALFSPYATVTNNSGQSVARAWNSLTVTANGGQQYWLQDGVNGQGECGLSLLLASAPPNDAFANPTPITLALSNSVTVTLDGTVTNAAYVANLVGDNYEATLDSGEYPLGNYTGVATTGHSVWWTFVPPTNGYVTVDPTKSTFITEAGIKPASAGVTGSFGGNAYGNNSAIGMFVTAGTQYMIDIDGSSQDPNGGMGGINLNVTFVPVPPNDNWAWAQPLVLQTNVLQGTLPDGTAIYTNYAINLASYNIRATIESGESLIGNYSGDGTPDRTVWFTLTPPATGYLSICTTNSLFHTQVGIKPASAGEGAGWYSYPYSGVGYIPAAYITGGTPYMICVDGTSLDAGYGIIDMELSSIASPVNDCWTNPTVINFITNLTTYQLASGVVTNTICTARLVGNNMSATLDSGEAEIGNYSGVASSGKTVWWTFTAPSNGWVKFNATNSTFRTQIGMKPASAGVGGSWYYDPYSSVGVVGPSQVTAGTQYMICVDGTTLDAGCGLIDLQVELDAAPGNDNYPGYNLVLAPTVNLQYISGYTVTNILYSATSVGYNAYATSDGYTLSSRFGGVTGANQNIWWNFVPPASGNVTVSLLGSTFDTLLGAGVYGSGSGTTPPYCNDDYNPGIVVQSLVTFPVTAGQSTIIEVDGKMNTPAGYTGGVNLTVTLPQPPANDLFANAQVLYLSNAVPVVYGNQAGLQIQAAGSTTYAGNQGENFEYYLGINPNQNVWFAYTPTNTATIQLTTTSPGSHLIAVYTGFNSGWIGGCAGTQGAAPNAGFEFTGTSGATYYICVDGTIPGPFLLTLNTFYTSPSNNTSGTAIPLTNGVTTTGACYPPTNAAWYSYTPSCTGELEADTHGSSAATYLAAYLQAQMLSVNVANGNSYWGEDCPGYVKTLTVVYSLGGVQGTNAVSEQQGTMTLGDGIHSLSVLSATWGAPECSYDNVTASVQGMLSTVYTLLASNTASDGTLQSRVDFPVTAGTTYYFKVGIASRSLYNFVITPNQTCDGNVNADPPTGTFADYGDIFLSAPADGTIYYSVNGAPYQVYTNGPTITPTNLVDVTANGSILTKTSGGSAWNAGFASVDAIVGDGFAEGFAASNVWDLILGLQAAYSAPTSTSIDYGIYLTGTANGSGPGLVEVVENSSNRGTFGNYSPGDRFRVVRSGQIVSYYHNGSLFYWSTVPSVGTTLHYACSMFEQGAQFGPCYLRNAGLPNETALVLTSGNSSGIASLSAYTQGGLTNAWNYTLQATAPVVLKGSFPTWNGANSPLVLYGGNDGQTLAKTSGQGMWQGVTSAQSSTGDCSVDWVNNTPVSATRWAAGLSTSSSVSSFSSLSYGWYDNYGTLMIYEGGASRGAFGFTQQGDIFRVERRGNTIYYYQNGNLVYPSTVTTTSALWVETLLEDVNSLVGPAAFYQGSGPTVAVVTNVYGDSTLYSSITAPGAPPAVTSTSPAAGSLAPALGNDYAFGNFRTGAAPSAQMTINYTSTYTQPPVFEVAGSTLYNGNPITVYEPSGYGGLWTITYPSGTQYLTNGGPSISFAPQGGGIYTASLQPGGMQSVSSSTNLNFVVNDLAITPSQEYSTIPFYVYANSTWPMSIYYSYASNVTPNILYSNAIVLGNTNVTICFMGTRTGFTPQFLTGTYAYSPTVIITPNGTFSNATAFTITGGPGIEYQVAGQGWQPYTGPFTLNGIPPNGSGTIMAYINLGGGLYSSTNTAPVTFQVAPVTTVPTNNSQVSGSYTVTASDATVGTTIYYAVGDSMGDSPPVSALTNVYTGPVAASGSTVMMFVGVAPNYANSPTNTVTLQAQAATPSFVTPSNTFSSPTGITVQSGDGLGGTYTLTQPAGYPVQSVTTTNATATFLINASGNYAATLSRNNWITSGAATNTYNFASRDFGISPAVSCLYSPTLVSFTWSGSNPSAPTFYYTLNGSLPTTGSPQYYGPFTLTNSATVTGLGVRPGYAPAYVTNVYTCLNAPTVAPAGGTFSSAQTVTASSAQATTLYFQTNGGAWQVYTEPLELDAAPSGNGTVTLGIRYDTTGCPGPTNQYTFVFQPAAPVIAPGGTNFNGQLTITATDSTSGATIMYATGNINGGAASASNITNVYSGPVTISSTLQLIFQAEKPGYENSTNVPEVYSSPMPAPSFVTPSTTFTAQSSISAASPLNTAMAFVLTESNGGCVTNNASGGSTSFTINQTGACTLQTFLSPWQPSPVATNSYTFQCADLSVTPGSENFASNAVVTASGAYNPSPMTIYYTTNGTQPTTNSTVYTGPIAVSNTETLTFLGTRQGYLPEYMTHTYTYAPGCVVAPGTSTNYQAITVTMTPYATNSSIFCRINGSGWTNYTGPFALDGYGSGVASMDYYTLTGSLYSPTNTTVYTFMVAPLSISPAGQDISGPITVTASTASPEASIHYAADFYGDTPLLANATNLYTGPITITNAAYFLFNGTQPGYISAQTTVLYSGQLPPPTILTPSGTFSNQTAISIQSGLRGVGSGWNIVSPDGTTNNTYSESDTLAYNINETGTYLVQNAKLNWQPSAFVPQPYSFVVADLQVTPPSGIFSTNTAVTAGSSISNPNPLVIYYSTNGTVPTTNSTLYTGPITISSNSTTFIWLATRAWYAPEPATNVYTYLSPINFSPGAGTYSNAIDATLSTVAPGATILYSYNGTNWSVYSNSFTLDGLNNGSGTLWVCYTNGTVALTNSYGLNFVVGSVSVSPASLTLGGPITVTASCGTEGAAINYSINPYSLQTSSLTNGYSGPLVVSNRNFLVFQGFKAGYQSSVQTDESYIEALPVPAFLTAGNVPFGNQTAITVEDPSYSINTIFYLSGPNGLNLQSPQSGIDSNGFPYAIFTINGTGSYIAWAGGSGWVTSGSVTNSYAFAVGDLVTTPSGLFDTATDTITASSSIGAANPLPLAIYYTLDGSQPTTSSAPYAAPITITNTTTVTWLAARTGYAPELLTNTYIRVQPITVSPPPGTNNNAINLALSAPNGQTIYYDIGGTGWQTYVQPAPLDGFGNGSVTVTATYTGGMTNSFTYYFQTLPPVVDPGSETISGPITVTASGGGTANCYIYYYGGDLGGDPADLTAAPTLYTGPLQVNGSRNIVFKATKTGYMDSSLVGASYTAQIPPLQVLTSGGAFTNVVQVNLFSGINGFGGTFFAVNPDGTTNTIDSTSPSVIFNINGSGTYTFFMTRTAWLPSPTTNWTGSFQVTDLQVSPAALLISDPNYPITATGDPSNPKPLAIYYALNGSQPTTNSTLYAGPLFISTNTTITWLATRAGYTPEYETNAFTYIPGAALSPTNSMFYAPQQFTLTGFAQGTIYYQTNYGQWQAYTSPFVVDGQTVIQYYAMIGQEYSMTNSFSANFAVTQPQTAPASEVASGPVTITATCSTPGATIYYGYGDMDGDLPPYTMTYSGSGSPQIFQGQPLYLWVTGGPWNWSLTDLTNLYTAGFTFDGSVSRQYAFIGRKYGYYDSPPATNLYTAVMPTPASALGTNLIISYPTTNTLSSSIPGQIYQQEPWEQWVNSGNNEASVQVTYTRPGAYQYFNTRGYWLPYDYIETWDPSPSMTVDVQFAAPTNFAGSLPLELVETGKVYTMGTMPNLYEGIGSLATLPPAEWGAVAENGQIGQNITSLGAMWYNWVAPANGLATVYTLDNDTGASNSFAYDFGQGTSLASFSSLAVNYQPTTTQVTAGQEYEIGIYPYAQTSTNFQVYLSFIPAPTNDNWASAYPVPNGGQQPGQQYTGYTLAATTEAGEPPGTNTVWFKYTAYQPGTLAVYPSEGQITCWQGSSVSNLTQVPTSYTTPLDPRWIDTYYVNIFGAGVYAFPNTYYNTNGIDFQVQAGTYYVRLSGPPTNYTITVEFNLPPINDNFAAAMTLPETANDMSTGTPRHYYQNNYTSEGATVEAGEPPNPLGPATVWYSWMAPAHGGFSVGAERPNGYESELEDAYPNQIDIYQGTSLGSLQEVSNELDNTTETIDTTGSATNTTFDTSWPVTSPSAVITVPASQSSTPWSFVWTSPVNGKVLIAGGTISAAVFVGASADEVEQVALNGSCAWGPCTQGSFDAIKGETYHVQVSSGQATTFQLYPIQPYSITAQAGQIYYIRLSGVGFQYQIEGTFSGEPANDNLNSAQVVSLPTYNYNNGKEGYASWEGTLVGAAIQTNGNVGQHGVWYEITPSFTGELEVLSDDSVYTMVYGAPNPNYNPDGGLFGQGGGVYAAQATATPLNLDGSAIPGMTLIPTVTFMAGPQSNYFIQISAASEIPFNAEAWLTEVPVNDMLTNALPLELSDFEAYNYYATIEPGEILPPLSQGASVWWSYVPSRNGTLTLSTLPAQGGAGSPFNPPTQLASVYQGTNWLDMQLLQTETWTNQTYAPIILNLLSNVQYWVSVDNFVGLGPSGNFLVSALYYPVPTNDDFAEATPLTSWETHQTDNGAFYYFTTTGSTFGATTEVGEPAQQTNSVWYTWLAPAKLLVYPVGTLPFYIYQGTSLQNLQPVNGSFFVAQPGQIYYIAVCGGPATFTFGLYTAAFPSDDMEANAIPVSSGSSKTIYDCGASRESFEQAQYSNSVWLSWNSGSQINLSGSIGLAGWAPLGFLNSDTCEIAIYDNRQNLLQDNTYSAGTINEIYNADVMSSYQDFNVPVASNGTYYISFESSDPGTVTINVAAPPAAAVVQKNVTGLTWTPLAGIANTKVLTATANIQNVPWTYYLNMPGSGNIVLSSYLGAACVQADDACYLVQNGATNEYEMLMPESGNAQDMIVFPTAGNYMVVDAQPPANQTRATAIQLSMAPAGPYLSTGTNTCNWLATSGDDGINNGVWYSVYIPTNGLLQIQNGQYPYTSVASTLHIIQTDATNFAGMASANILDDQECPIANSTSDFTVTPGYYFVVQSDGPTLANFGLTLAPVPTNTYFTDAATVAWSPTSYVNGMIYGAQYSVDLNGALTLPGEPPAAGRQIWFTTVAPGTGQLTCNSSDSIYTGDGTLAGLQMLYGANQGPATVTVTAGEKLWIQCSDTTSGFDNIGTHSMQLTVAPCNDAFVNAIGMTNFVPVTPTNWNGQQVYEYTFQAPAGFWTQASDGHYIRNWYRIESTTNLLNVTVSQPDSSSGYYDFGASQNTEIQGNLVVYGQGTHFYYPQVWGSTPYAINVPQTWDYYEEEALYNDATVDPTYRGLFDLSAFPVGPGISYLYAAPKNILFQDVQSVLVQGAPASTVSAPSPCTYTFIMAAPDPVWIIPIFPCAAAQPIFLTAQTQSQQLTGYDYLATTESNEVVQPGSFGSTWWSMNMPFAGSLTVQAAAAQGAAPLLYLWKGTTMINLQLVASNYNNSGVVGGLFNGGDSIMISADIGANGPGIFTLTTTEGPPVANGTPDTSQFILPHSTAAFANGQAWVYTQPYNIQTGATNLWYQMIPPASGWLQRLDQDQTAATVYQPVLQDIQLIPPSCGFAGTLTVSVSTENDIYGPSTIYCTTDGSAPTTNAPVYTAPFVLTNTTTIRLLVTRPGRAPETCTGTYTYQGSVYCSLAENGNYSAPVTFTLSSDNPNATLLYSYSAGGPWNTYTRPVTLDGLGSGSGYVYYTQAVDGTTNEAQFDFLEFTVPVPQISPLNAVFQGTNIVITSSGSDPVYYQKLTINQLVAGGFSDNEANSANSLSTGTFTGSMTLAPGNYMFEFQTQKTGYNLSPALVGTYLEAPQ